MFNTIWSRGQSMKQFLFQQPWGRRTETLRSDASIFIGLALGMCGLTCLASAVSRFRRQIPAHIQNLYCSDAWTREKYYTTFNKKIGIHPDIDQLPGGLEKIENDLNTINSGPVGRRLLDRIASNNHPVFIHYVPGIKDKMITSEKSSMRGEGSMAVILLDPSNPGRYYTMEGHTAPMPPWYVLAHELIHAYHSQNGKRCPKDFHLPIDYTLWSNAEEYHAIMGLPSKNPNRDPTRPKISDYALLKEHGFLPRYGHIPPSSINSRIAQAIKIQREANEKAGNPAIPVLVPYK